MIKVVLSGLAAGVLAVIFLLTASLGGDGAFGGFGTGLRAGSVPAPYAALIQQAGRTCPAAPPSVLAAQLKTESGFNPRAISPAGAEGIAQFTPSTWATRGVDGNGDGRRDPFDPADAIPTQAAYDCALAQQLTVALTSGQVIGNLTSLMLAAYNAGPAAVIAARGIPGIQETQGYVTQITNDAGSFADTTGSMLPAGSFGAKLLAAASSQAGVAYSWGGGSFTGPTSGIGRGTGTVGFDCSGLVLYAAYQASGGTMRLPHSADAQTRTGTHVPTDQLQPGDVISFTTPGAPAAHHVGIYAGNGQMINAPQTGSTVKTSPLSDWTGETWRAVRYAI